MELEKSLPRISKLPNYLIDQIKAGEVIESPSALLKELLENSLDAHATQVDIEIENNGISKLLIRDNGDGMCYDDLPMAFARHATSKISAYDDLYNLFSFGFRGEALASAASVSRLNCISATRDLVGGKISLEGGKILSHLPTKLNAAGTTIIVSDLFFNTPARMKFIKGQKAEKKSLQRVINGYILSNPHINFSIKWDQEDKQQFPVTLHEKNPLASRTLQLLPWLNSENELITFEQEYDHHKVIGIITKESTKSTSKRAHYLFANKRLFTEQSYHYLITQSCKKIWNEGEQGSYILFIESPPDQIDVNVHPSKTRIKFEKAASVYALISSSIKNIVKSQVSDSSMSQNELTTPSLHHNEMELEKNTPYDTANLEFRSEQLSFSTLQYITSDVLLWCHGDQKYLVGQRDLFLRYIEKKLVPEHEEIPLLITPILNITSVNDKLAGFLMDNNIYIERSGQDTHLLRALPQALIDLPVKNLLQEIFHQSTILESIQWNSILPYHYCYQSILQAIPVDTLEDILTKDSSLWFKISYDNIKR